MEDLTVFEGPLQSLKKKYSETKDNLSPQDLETWKQLSTNLQQTMQEMDQLLQRNMHMQVSFLLNDDKPAPKKSLDRVLFYSDHSPYRNQMDKSRTFRICPPMVHKSAADYFKKVLPQDSLALSDGQILENLANLKRLADLQR